MNLKKRHPFSILFSQTSNVLHPGLSTVSVAKAAVQLACQRKKTFSIRNIKLMNNNKIVTERIFSNLALELNCKKTAFPPMPWYRPIGRLIKIIELLLVQLGLTKIKPNSRKQIAQK